MSAAAAAASADGAAVERAYAACAAITRREAANFYYGIRLLPADKRRAMCAVYALARRIDDIGDGMLPAPEKLRQLEQVERRLAAISSPATAPEPPAIAPEPPAAAAAEAPVVAAAPPAAPPDAAAADPVFVALAAAARARPLPLDAFGDLVAGVRMDVEGFEYERFDQLELYCRRVAGSIGRLCVGVFGSEDPARALALADDLGVAMQLTNILRDIREDAANGRVYIPADELARFDLDRTALLSANGSAPLALVGLVREHAARAHEWFGRGLELMPLLDRRSAACVAAMTGIYRRLLARIEADPAAVLRERLSLPGWEKALVATRSLIGAAL